MGLLRRSGFMAAAAMSALLALYFVVAADRAVAFLQTDDALGKGIGIALLVFPVIGIWWLINEWRLGSAVQRMADVLEEQGRLPFHDGQKDEHGRLSAEAKASTFELASRGVELAPNDWVAWFHVAYAYDASGDRRMARKSLRYAASLFKEAKVAAAPEGSAD